MWHKRRQKMGGTSRKRGHCIWGLYAYSGNKKKRKLTFLYIGKKVNFSDIYM